MNMHSIKVNIIGDKTETKNVKLVSLHIDGLVQERRTSIANERELRHSCTNPSTFYFCDISISHHTTPQGQTARF